MISFRAHCVLFDLDGTLVDTAPDLGHAANSVRVERGLTPLPLARYRAQASAGARGLLKIALNLNPGDPDYGACRERFLHHYVENLTRHSRLFPGMDETLRAFEQRGLRWGVVTNKPYALAEPLLRGLDLLERCACLIGGDTAPKAKPAPDPLLWACERLALQPADCLYVGDDRRDVEAARAAAMPVVAAAWGYIGEGEDINDWSADVILDQPEQLIGILE